MTAVVAVLTSLLFVAILALIGVWGLYRQALRECQTAQDRLYAAWREGAAVPPRPEPVPVQEYVDEPLPPDLEDLVMEWESREAQLIREAEIRRLMSQGWTPVKIIGYFEEQRFRSAGDLATK